MTTNTKQHQKKKRKFIVSVIQTKRKTVARSISAYNQEDALERAENKFRRPWRNDGMGGGMSIEIDSVEEAQ